MDISSLRLSLQRKRDRVNRKGLQSLHVALRITTRLFHPSNELLYVRTWETRSYAREVQVEVEQTGKG